MTRRWVRSRGKRRALILGYHRVADRSWDPYGIAVSPERFSEQLQVIRDLAEPVPLATLAAECPDRSVALTFDDGYADNVSEALPRLDLHRIPATMFVATDYVDGRFWWDELADRLAPGRRLPDPIELEVGGTRVAWRPTGGDREARTRLVREMHQRLRTASEDDRGRALDDLRRGMTQADDGAAPRALRDRELRALAAHPRLEIGAHTRSHASLGEIAAERQAAEIAGSKRWLEERLRGKAVESFSYPNGSTSAQAASILAAEGFRRACGSREDLVTARSERFDLPRFWVPDWSAGRFSRWLRRWLGSARRHEV